MKAKTWREMVEKAEHYTAIGECERWLDEDAEKPWEFLSGVEDGCASCYGETVNVFCRAKHPSGLTFQWHVDLVKHEYGIEPDIVAGAELVSHLTPKSAPVVRRLLKALAEKWFAWEAEQRAAASKSHGFGRALMALVEEAK